MTEQDKIEILKDGILELFDDISSIDLTSETEFSHLGLDSLDTIELQLYVENKLAVRISEPTGPVKTISDFIKLMP
jgi:acyl carrier protein